MNDRRQFEEERERRSRGFEFPPDAPAPQDIAQWHAERARQIRQFFDALKAQEFSDQEALLLTGRLFKDE